jgi:CRP-like cAMP-binding protein
MKSPARRQTESIARPHGRNAILERLSPTNYRRILPHLKQVSLTFGEKLYEPGRRVNQVYFPENALVSVLTLVDGRLPLEVRLIGYEGLLGTSVALGAPVSALRAVVQGSGTAQSMTSQAFLSEFGRDGAPHRDVLLYVNALMAQLSQTAACNRFHVVQARLARWLLMASDRVRSDRFPMTQEFLSYMLGVRRVGVSNAARVLMKRGLIAYSRGRIAILERAGLEEAACSCYRLMCDLHAASPVRPKRSASRAPRHVTEKGAGGGR